MAMKTNGINGIGIGIANACSIQISPLRVTVTVPYLAFAWPYFILLYLTLSVQSGVPKRHKQKNQKPETSDQYSYRGRETDSVWRQGSGK